ncbi:helix-turn-helix domain-containing protein [Rahnella bonaserana]
MELEKIISPYAQEIIDELSPFLTFETLPAKQMLSFVENDMRKCYFMRRGVVLLYRDNVDGFLMSSFSSPFVSGLGDYKKELNRFNLVTAEECEIAKLNRKALYDIVEKNNLWRLIAQQMQYVSERLMKYSALFSAMSSYDIISNQLRILMHEPELIRENILAEKYIRSKTQLSRSGIMRILAELKTGGYIVMEEGILKEIKHLPAKY